MAAIEGSNEAAWAQLLKFVSPSYHAYFKCFFEDTRGICESVPKVFFAWKSSYSNCHRGNRAIQAPVIFRGGFMGSSWHRHFSSTVVFPRPFSSHDIIVAQASAAACDSTCTALAVATERPDEAAYAMDD